MVKLFLDPSLKIPIAVNWWLVPSAIVTSPSLISSDTSEFEATVKDVLPLMPPEAASIVVEPIVPAVASPVAAIDATAVVDELQVAVEVRF